MSVTKDYPVGTKFRYGNDILTVHSGKCDRKKFKGQGCYFSSKDVICGYKSGCMHRYRIDKKDVFYGW